MRLSVVEPRWASVAMSAVNLLCSAATFCGKWSGSPSAQSATRRRRAGSSSRCVEPPRALSASRQCQGVTATTPRLDASSICTGLEQCWVGHDHARRHISRACRDKRSPVHGSLIAAFIAQNGADLNAPKCAAGLWVPRPKPRLVVSERLFCSVALRGCLKVGRALPMTVGKTENTCRAGALLLVGFVQFRPRGNATGRRAYGTKSPPLLDGGGEGGHGAVDRLILQIEVHPVGAFEHRARHVGCCGAGRRGAADGGRIGDRDAGRWGADPGRHDRRHGNLSLKAAFVGERDASLLASKCAARLRRQRPGQHDGICARDDLTVCAEAARLAKLALHGCGLPVTVNETVFG